MTKTEIQRIEQENGIEYKVSQFKCDMTDTLMRQVNCTSNGKNTKHYAIIQRVGHMKTQRHYVVKFFKRVENDYAVMCKGSMKRTPWLEHARNLAKAELRHLFMVEKTS